MSASELGFENFDLGGVAKSSHAGSARRHSLCVSKPSSLQSVYACCCQLANCPVFIAEWHLESLWHILPLLSRLYTESKIVHNGLNEQCPSMISLLAIGTPQLHWLDHEQTSLQLREV